jgi:HD-like signal output (HDOD) protein/nitrogen-specific signal transduction histidine kinase
MSVKLGRNGPVNGIPGPVLRAIESLHMPAMPQVILRFFNAAGGDSASMDELAELVLQDPALSARVLTVANSAAFRRGAEMRSIKQSLTVLGTSLVRTIASCSLVQSAFRRVPGSEARELAGFWHHSLLVAELARGIATELGVRGDEVEEAYLAGLLHDVGQLLLLGGLGDAYGAILGRAEGEDGLFELEHAVLDTDHGVVGAWLVDQWELPSLMADAILFHHLTADKVGDLDRLGRILWCAHFVCVAPQVAGDAGLAVVERLIGIEVDRLDALYQEALSRVDALALALDIEKAPREQTVPSRIALRLPDAPDAPPLDAHEAALQAATAPMTALQTLPLDLPSLHSEIDLLLCVQEAGRLIFGVQHLAFFLLQPQRQVLTAVRTGANGGALQRLEIALSPDGSLCARSALTRQMVDTFDVEGEQAPAPTDRQIARALKAEGLMYLPLLAGGVLIGVIALGVSSVQRTRLSARLPWLRNFAGIVAANLRAWRLMREREAQIEAEVAGRFVLQGQRVAHEVNNPLAIIRNYLTLIANDAADGGSAGAQQSDIAVLREEIERLSGIVTNLAADTSLPAAPDGMTDLNQIVEAMRTVYQASLFDAAGVRLDVDLPPERVFACVDRDHVKQIIFNLWKNAALALKPGGVVVTTLAARVNQNGEMFARILIHDSGPGLPAAVLDSLYRPLQHATAAARPEGRSGLGLSIVLALVERLRGSISCHSQPGRGTTFTILLPESQRTVR